MCFAESVRFVTMALSCGSPENCTLGENIQNEHSGIEILGVIVA